MTAKTAQARKVIVNGEPVATCANTLAELLSELELTAARVATARNGDFVPGAAWGTTRLEVGDRIEIVSPRHGG